MLLLILLVFSFVLRRLYDDMMGGNAEPLSLCAELALNKSLLLICGIALSAVIIFAKSKNHLIYFLCADILWSMFAVMMMLSPTLYITVRMGGRG